MRTNKKGFTLIELLIVVVIVGILALAAIPLITSNTRDARRAEGEQILGATRNQCRVAFAKAGDRLTGALTAPTTSAGAGAGAGIVATELAGQYFGINPATALTGNAATQALVADPAQAIGGGGNTNDGTGTLTFAWDSGAAAAGIVWADPAP